MKLLLDENLPKRLKQDFPEHQILTVRDMNWQSKENGELLSLMISEGFKVLFTFDRNLKYQQNFKKYPIPVLVLCADDNSYLTLSKLIPKIRISLGLKLENGVCEIK